MASERSPWRLSRAARKRPHVADEELPLGRLEAFSDGVFAIAITLVVLELGVSHAERNHLASSLLHEWPSFLAYVTSFMTIGSVWLQHSAITSTLRSADARLYQINLLVLLLVAFLPFPTKLITEFIGDTGPLRVAVVFYGVALLALGLALRAFVRYAAEHRALVKDQVDADTIEERANHRSILVLCIAGILAGLVYPPAGVVLYLASALYRGLPLLVERSAAEPV
jgi:uncharacterized membrane protein